MSEFVYTTVPGKIKPLLVKIRSVGVPPKVTVQWLKTIGFTSSNDASLIGVLKFIDLIDSSQIPTARWTQYRGASHKSVLGEAIRKGYADLFAVYPDADNRNQTELDHVFSTSSTGGKQVIAKTISTFKALTEEASFSPIEEQTDLTMGSGPLHSPIAQQPATQQKGPTFDEHKPSLHIDVQVHISPEASADQIEQIFASMAKHLYGRAKTE